MRNEILERQLKGWFSQMLQKYTWLSIKYEYCDAEKCFLVSFSPKALTNMSEEFSADALEFENKVNEEYGDEAPLFCDDEDLFKLSRNARCLTNPIVNVFTSEFSPQMVQPNLVKSQMAN